MKKTKKKWNKKVVFLLILLILIFMGFGFKYENEVSALRTNRIVGLYLLNSFNNFFQTKLNSTASKDSYTEAINIKNNPSFTTMYFHEDDSISFIGNLNPFPTKSSQTFNKLKSIGIVNSPKTNLELFYKQQGPLTKSSSTVKKFANTIRNGETTADTIKNIIEWEHTYLNKQNCGNRRDAIPADKIISRRCASGCTDYTIVFVAIARAKGISATITETISEKWLAEMAWENKWNYEIKGHFFSEVYLPEKEKWIIADPTAKKFLERDNKGYYLSGDKGEEKFMLFERGLDPADYKIPDTKTLSETIRKRYYIQPGDQP